jgi:hypothetical protein
VVERDLEAVAGMLADPADAGSFWTRADDVM